MKKIFGILFTLLYCSSLVAQDTLPSFITDSLDSYVEKAMVDWQIPGVAVAIVKDGKAVWMKGYGVTEKGSSNKVDENTLFMIGSNSKAFTATALAMLEADKKLYLNDRVQKWLPDFTLYDPWVANEANIRDLLCHRLGFQTFQGDFMFFDSDLTTQEVRDKFGKIKPAFSFRSQWGYTNAAFMTAGEIIPKASGLSWAQYLEANIFKPLDMNRTLALSKDILTATNKAAAHTLIEGVTQKRSYGNIDNLAPAGSISSSASDMSHWVMMQLNNGKYNGQQVVPSYALRQTWSVHSIMGDGGHMFNKAHFSLYGLGWMLQEYEGRKIVSHTGGVNGFVTAVTLVPEEKLGIIVLTNTDMNSLYEALKQEILDAYLGLPFRNYSKLYADYFNSQEKRKAASIQKIKDTIALHNDLPVPPSSFEGNYVHNIYGNMKIGRDNGKFIARFEHHKRIHATLEYINGNRFLATFSDPLYGIEEWPFTIENGKVRSINVSVADFVEGGDYEFVKL